MTTIMRQRYSIPNPCTKKWADFSGEGRERFCDSCQTRIYDLEQHSSEELAALRQTNGGKICGLLSGESEPIPRSRRAILIGALLTAVSPLMAENGRIRIRVKDPIGAVVPGVNVALIGPEGQPKLTRLSDDKGEAIFADLPLGDASFLISAAGFRRNRLTATVKNADELLI